MKIKQEQVHQVCRMILGKLEEKKLAVLKAPEEKIHQALVQTILSNLQEEARLHQEAERILEENIKESEGLDRQKMFLMIKRKLAKDRGFIL
jgi:hypothetical protein